MSTAPGSGSRLQLAALGVQDLYLRGECRPFLASWRRATRFAAWTEELKMPYVPGTRTQIDLPKSGDMLGDMYLQIILPAVPSAPPGATWNKLVGYTLFRRVRLLLNDQELHNIERLWYDLHDRLYVSSGHAKGVDRMVGRTPLRMNKKQILQIPLRMMTCRKGASRPTIPLQAMPSSSLKLDIEWDKPEKLSEYTPTDPGIDVRVLVDYIELEDPEKSKILQGTTLAFESVIDSDALSYYIDSDGLLLDTPSIKVNLGNVRFAVKMLAWVAYQEDAGTPLFTYLSNPLQNINVTFNNQDRFDMRPKEYFEILQKYQHTAQCTLGPPGVYSFAFDATSRYPSGVADFGALSQVFLNGTVAPGNPRFKLKVFSVYYNFLQIGESSGKVIFV